MNWDFSLKIIPQDNEPLYKQHEIKIIYKGHFISKTC